MSLPDNNSEWAEYYDKLAQRAEYNYQDSGDPKYETRRYKYECAADAFRIAANRTDWKAQEKQRRQDNIQHIIDTDLYKQAYTREEVKNLLIRAMFT